MQTATRSEGRYAAGEFPSVLRGLVQSFAGGRLEVDAEGTRRQLWLDAGEVCAVASEDNEEKLAAWLVRRDLLQPHEMALALLRLPEDVRFGAFLVQQGRLEAEQLEEEAVGLAVTILASLLVVPGGYRFFEGEHITDNEAPLGVTTANLLVAAVRAVTETQRLEIFAEANSFLWGAQSVLLQYQRVHLTPPEAFLLSRIDGTTTRNQLQRLVPLSSEQVTRSLAALVVAGLVELRPGAASQPGPVARVEHEEEQPKSEEKPPKSDEVGLQFTPDEREEHDRVVRLAAECRSLDFYRRLSLNTGATLGQIHDRFREYARLYHPDRASEPHLRSLRRNLADIHSGIGEAYETLSVPDKRSKYDAALRSGSQNASGSAQEERHQRARRELVAANKKRAQELMRAGNFGAAIPLLDQAIRLDAEGETLLLLARLEMRNPMWSQRALDHLRQAVTLEPQLTEAWLELARFWGRRKRPEKRRQCLERVLAYDATNSEALSLLAETDARA